MLEHIEHQVPVAASREHEVDYFTHSATSAARAGDVIGTRNQNRLGIGDGDAKAADGESREVGNIVANEAALVW